MAGVIVKMGSAFFLEPDNNHVPFKIKIAGGIKFEENDRVTIEVLRGDVPTGRVIEVLGKADDIKACELAIIRDHQLYETFTSDVVEAARKFRKR